MEDKIELQADWELPGDWAEGQGLDRCLYK